MWSLEGRLQSELTMNGIELLLTYFSISSAERMASPTDSLRFAEYALKVGQKKFNKVLLSRPVRDCSAFLGRDIFFRIDSIIGAFGP